ncbi:hypothetical protein [Acinetobacter sp.]|uniref:hypothetical protein n=1 Tax=Acinetobacter sp. TaxID=472 RepID=UPI003890B640
MKVIELLQEKVQAWTCINLAKAINQAKAEITKKLDAQLSIAVDSGEVVFDVESDEDIAALIKPFMKPFIIKTSYKKKPNQRQYHYYLNRPLVNGEITRTKRELNR